MPQRLHPITAVSAALLLALALPAPHAARAAAGPAALHSGAWAVELDKDMGSSYFANNEVSIKHMMSATSAFRLGLGISYNGGTGPGTITVYPAGTSTPTQNSNIYRTYTVRLDWVHHFAIAGNFDAQLGIGPVYSYNSGSYAYGDPTAYHYNSSSKTTQVGGELNIGGEWFFADRFSLGGRFGIVASSGKYRDDYASFNNATNGNRTHTEYTEKQVFTDPARIILTGYF